MLLPRLSFSRSTFLREGFSQVTDDTLGKALHALCLTGVFHLSIFQANTLIYFYSRSGHIKHARYLFDKLPVRNEASWNTIVSGYVRAGFYPEAFEFFSRNRGLGLCPNGVILASLVTACDRSACMANEGFQLHAVATKMGLIDLFVGTSLLHFYGAYGFVSLSRKFFNEMPDKNVVSWTSLMVGYLDSNDPCEVVNLYRSMRREGIVCNENTFSTVISSCSLLENDWVGRQVLGHVIKVGLEGNVSVGNSIISMFGNSGSAEEACYIFDQMGEHDTISWNAIISANANNGLYEESLDWFRQMRNIHNHLNSTTLSTLLTVSGSPDRLRVGEALHGLLLKLGFKLNTCAYNTLLNMYSQAGRYKDAESVFYEMSERDLITWNSMIAGCVMNRRCLNGLKLFSEMLLLSKSMNYVSFTSAISACSSPEFSIQGKVVHALAVTAGLRDNLIISNALITMYGKLHLILEAQNIFDNVMKPDIVTCNALIGGYAENEECGGAMRIFKLMRRECVSINYITITSVIGACLTSDDLKGGTVVHAYLVLTGYESDRYVQNSLISMYMRCGDQSSGTRIFNEMDYKDVFAWNVIISGSAHYGYPEDALKLMVKMIASGIELDNFSFSGGLAAVANLAALEEGHLLHALAVKLGLNSDLYVVNALMDMYAKCGEINDVLSILPEPIDRSRMSWNVLISAYARHSYFQKAKGAFHEMLELGMKPDHVTFVALLSACSHGGLVEEGLAYFDSMEKEFGVSPRIEQCVCIVDLLGRSGKFAEAEAFIEKMPVSPNDHIWRSLLAACKVHGNLALGKKAVENLLAFDPLDDSAYVLYSNICATSRRWDEMEKIRKKMGSIRKQPACSWVKLKDGVSSFGMGDKSHPQMKQIYAKLEEIKKIIKGAGYVPETSFVYQDTDEEQKEFNLWNHSERLALAFGLINIPEAMPIRVFKNLRVCGDCHSVYKIVSKMVGRKIIMRDPYRFHHFEDGHCSCSDYW